MPSNRPLKVSKNFRRKKRFNKKKKTGWVSTIKSAGKTIGDVAQVAGTALTIAKSVAALVNVEKKYCNTTLSSFNVENTNWIGGCLNQIAEGDDYLNRNGRSLKATNLHLRMQVVGQSNMLINTFRFIILQDLGCQGAVPTPANIWSTTSGDNIVNSYRNYDSAAFRRYKILSDQTYNLDNKINIQQTVTLNMPINSHINFIGTTNAVADIGSNSLFYFFSCKGTNAANTGCTITNLNARLYFIDN